MPDALWPLASLAGKGFFGSEQPSMPVTDSDCPAKNSRVAGWSPQSQLPFFSYCQPPQRPKSALERLYSGDHQRSKMSAEEQLERMKRHQKALVRERKRTLSQGERTGQPSSRYHGHTLPGDLGSVC